MRVGMGWVGDGNFVGFCSLNNFSFQKLITHLIPNKTFYFPFDYFYKLLIYPVKTLFFNHQLSKDYFSVHLEFFHCFTHFTLNP